MKEKFLIEAEVTGNFGETLQLRFDTGHGDPIITVAAEKIERPKPAKCGHACPSCKTDDHVRQTRITG